MAVLVRVMAKSERLLPLLREQVQLEFLHNATEPDAILRGNCVATRMMSAYAASMSAGWLCKTLRSTVKLLMAEPAAWVLDATRVPTGTPAEKEARAHQSQVRLMDAAVSFLRKLRGTLSKAPAELRCMVYLVWIQARTFVPERTAVLLGGFLFLRLLNPALVAPDTLPGLLRAEDPRESRVCLLLRGRGSSAHCSDQRGVQTELDSALQTVAKLVEQQVVFRGVHGRVQRVAVAKLCSARDVPVGHGNRPGLGGGPAPVFALPDARAMRFVTREVA